MVTPFVASGIDYLSICGRGLRVGGALVFGKNMIIYLKRFSLEIRYYPH
jgi:hypothetical protein